MIAADQPSAAHGLFGPGSMVWRVDREIAVLLGSGARALLLQVAHPKVAAAVAEHSRYRADPLGRLHATLDAIYTFAFAESTRACAVVEAINRRHATIRGLTPLGEPYAALDPTLLLWVYATLIDSSMLAYETFVSPLRAEEREAYYAEMRRTGPLWGIPLDKFPATLPDLRSWMADLIDRGEVQVSEQGRTASRFIVRPALWWLPPGLTLPLEVVAVWLLPPRLRQQFGFAWGPRRERVMRALAAASRLVVPRLPSPVRDLPIARAAERRVRSEHASWHG
jgi:uncharacterized protein (DUF2236 family)